MARPKTYVQYHLDYVIEHAGTKTAAEIAAHFGVNKDALRKQCVSWRAAGHKIPSLLSVDPIGTISKSTNRRGAQWMRIKTADGWQRLSRVNYLKAFGPIPADKNVGFKDGNQFNCEPENLMLISCMPVSTGRPKTATPKPKTRKLGGATTSKSRKPGTDPNWVQKHLAPKKELVIKAPPTAAGVRLDAKTIVYPKDSNYDINNLRARFGRK